MCTGALPGKTKPIITTPYEKRVLGVEGIQYGVGLGIRIYSKVFAFIRKYIRINVIKFKLMHFKSNIQNKLPVRN
jgi:hypothetical protein